MLNLDELCICQSPKRFNKFLDNETLDENNKEEGKRHVRTIDLFIIQHEGLRQALQMRLNYIPLRSTVIYEAIQVIHDTFLRVCQVLDVKHMLDMATKEVRQISKKILLNAYKLNKLGFKYSQPYLFTVKVVNDELNWFLNYVYISGLDEASTNACFICIIHIRK